jgi:hypothetical protein
VAVTISSGRGASGPASLSKAQALEALKHIETCAMHCSAAGFSGAQVRRSLALDYLLGQPEPRPGCGCSGPAVQVPIPGGVKAP